MKLYLAGPMRGIKDFNFPLFLRMAKDLRSRGHVVWNPAERDLDEGFDPTKDQPQSFRHYMQHDLPQVMAADAVAVLPGWRDSKGARLEVLVALECDIPVVSADTLHPVGESILEEAQRLVHGNRGTDYGHPIEDFTRTGRIWAAVLGLDDVTPEQVALCMIGVKMSRECHHPKRDNRTDIAGYAETLDMVRERQSR